MALEFVAKGRWRMERPPRKQYTTHLFPNHFASVQRIAELTGRKGTDVYVEALKSLIRQVQAGDEEHSTQDVTRS